MDEYTVGKASCNLSTFDQGPEKVRNATKVLTHLYVEPEHRRQGHASKLLSKLGREADEAMVAILLEPNAYDDGEMTQEQLIAFYKQFGFIELQKEPYLMVRIPVNPMLAMQLKTQAPRILLPN